MELVSKIGIVSIIILAVLLIAWVCSFLGIWAINTLFGLNIGYGLEEIVAMSLLMVLFKPAKVI